MAQTGIVKDKQYMDHVASTSHPETHQRLEVVYEMLEEPGMKGTLKEIKPRMATQEELELIHVPRYIQQVAVTADHACVMLDPDTYACAKSYETAKLAAGGTLAAVDEVVGGKLNNAFALIRPPGHHAESNREYTEQLENPGHAPQWARKGEMPTSCQNRCWPTSPNRIRRETRSQLRCYAR